jgi:hypothetical protein
MKKQFLCLIGILLMAPCYAENVIRISAPITKSAGVWAAGTALNSQWVNTADPAVCSTWTPDPATISEGTLFQQTSADCKQNQISTSQPREQNSVTLAYRNVGAPQAMAQVATVAMTRTATGTKAVWFAAAPLTSPWVNTADAAVCSTWTPDPTTITAGTSFQQTSVDCKQNQTRTSQSREQNSTTLEYRNVGVAQTLSQVVTVTMSRMATGTSIPVSLAYKDSIYCAGNGICYATFNWWGGSPITNSVSYPLKALSQGGYLNGAYNVDIGVDASKIKSGQLDYLNAAGSVILSTPAVAPTVFFGVGTNYFYSCGSSCDAAARTAHFFRLTMVLK